MFLFGKISAFPFEFVIQLLIAKQIDKLVCYETVAHSLQDIGNNFKFETTLKKDETFLVAWKTGLDCVQVTSGALISYNLEEEGKWRGG